MDHWEIEYARMRQGDIDREFKAVQAARVAGSGKLWRLFMRALSEAAGPFAWWFRRKHEAAEP